MLKSIPFAALAAFALTQAASAAVPATTSVDLNLRVAPSAASATLGVLPAGTAVSVQNCATDSQWCMVTTGAAQGWAYSAYLTGANGAPVADGTVTLSLAQPPAAAPFKPVIPTPSPEIINGAPLAGNGVYAAIPAPDGPGLGYTIQGNE